jgi:hypothetical protein
MNHGLPKWKVHDIELPETPGIAYPLFYRCPVECAKFLLGNPSFKEHFDYAPDEIFDTSKTRVYHEISSGDIWNKLQVSIVCQFLCAHVADIDKFISQVAACRKAPHS